MKPLYALVEQFRELERLDVEEIDDQALADTLEGLKGEITVKATNCALFARNIETFADTVDEAAAQMAERAKRLRRKADSIRAYLLDQMRGAGISKIQAPEFTVSIRKNPAAVQIAPDAAIPQEYMVVPEPPPPRPDKRKLAEALKSGETIDGVRLEQSERLDIR
jgi:hypothetical protein